MVARRIVITGGAGFIGANLARFLTQQSHDFQVAVIDDLSSGSRENLKGLQVEFIEGSILDRALVDAVFEGADAIVHLAARPSVPRSLADPLATNVVNVDGTLNVLQAAQALSDALVIVASSSSVYGANPVLPKHELLTPMPMSPYAVSKLAEEQYALAWQYSFGLRSICFRFFNVYGPLQQSGHAYAAVVPAFVAASISGEPLVVHGDGSQTRDFTYVDTVCDVIATAIEQNISSPSPINLAFGTKTRISDLADLIDGITCHTAERNYVDARNADVKHSQADNSLLREMFPDVKATPLSDGLRTTISWMQSISTVA